MAGRSLLLRAEPGFSLPAWERLAPPPPPSLVSARLETASTPGDIVLDPFGRGGWVARAAIDHQRRAVSLESTALDRLLAEVVLRPPDLRHLDAAVQALAASARRETSLKAWITNRFASRCATCDRPVILDEVTWTIEGADGDGQPGDPGQPGGPRPIRKHYRCHVCRDQLGGGENRQAPLDAADIARALDPDDDDSRPMLRERFPTLDGGDALPDELLDLHTPRQLAALAAILERVEGDLRARSIESALRLAVLQAVAPSSRLAITGGRVAALRISAGHLRPPGGTTWRERNPWVAFEDGIRTVRGFVQRLEGATWGPVPARLGEDLRSLDEGAATAVLRQDTPAALAAIAVEMEHLAGTGIRPRVRLVLGAVPLRPAAERLAWAYHGTAWALGRDAAATLPLEPLFGPAIRASWSWQAAAITRSLRGIAPALARDARTVLLLEGEGAESLIATALGGITAGYRLVAARLPEPGGDGTGAVEFSPPGSSATGGGPRTRANVPLEPTDGRARRTIRSDRLFAPPERAPSSGPFSADEAARAVVDAAVDVLKMRGEPVSFGGLLGEILVGLDRAGHLRQLVRPPAQASPDSPQAAGHDDPSADAADAADGEPAPGHVERLLALVREALADTQDRRLVKLQDERWWLAQRTDRDAAAVPLSDRVEWAVFSLLSTSGPLSEGAFLERIGGLFTGPDLPDDGLVRACLESYRSIASTPERLLTTDDLSKRSQEHTGLIADLVDLGHRLGFSCWIGARQQSRRVGRATLGRRLDSREAAGPPYLGRLRAEDLEDVDVIWYVRGRMAFLWEVEWTAMLGDTILRRHARMAPDERVVRFCVVLPERVELIRYKLERSPLLRAELDEGGWHLLKADHLREWAGRESVALADMEPLLGLDPAIERTGDQLSLFGGPSA
jgi:hypothetical protein